jgi:hypothetical protein
VANSTVLSHNAILATLHRAIEASKRLLKYLLLYIVMQCTDASFQIVYASYELFSLLIRRKMKK